MGLAGLEPATSVLSGLRSNQLSYRPFGHQKILPEPAILRKFAGYAGGYAPVCAEDVTSAVGCVGVLTSAVVTAWVSPPGLVVSQATSHSENALHAYEIHNTIYVVHNSGQEIQWRYTSTLGLRNATPT